MSEKQNDKRQPTAWVHQEIYSFSADKIITRTFKRINDKNYPTIYKYNNYNYKRYNKVINNKNYENKR